MCVCILHVVTLPTVSRVLLKRDFPEFGFASAINYKQT
jgi:hypothetical protein